MSIRQGRLARALLPIVLLTGAIAVLTPAAASADIYMVGRGVVFQGVPVTAHAGDRFVFTVSTVPDDHPADSVYADPLSANQCAVESYNESTRQLSVVMIGSGECLLWGTSDQYYGEFEDYSYQSAYGFAVIYVDVHEPSSVVINGAPTGPVQGDEVTFQAYVRADGSALQYAYAYDETICHVASYDTVTLDVTVNLLANGQCTVLLRNATGPGIPLAHDLVTFEIDDPRQSQIISSDLSDRPAWPEAMSLGWSSSSGLPLALTSTTPDVCSVDGDQFTPVTPGTCTITAVQAGNSEWWPVETTRSFNLYYDYRQQTVTFPYPYDSEGNQTASMVVGDDRWGDLTLAATASSGLPITYYSLTPSFCSVSANVAHALFGGTCTIRAQQDGIFLSWMQASADLTLSVQFPYEPPPDPEAQMYFPQVPGHAVTDPPFAVTLTGWTPVTLTSDTTGVCTVSGLTVSLHASGVCTLRAVQEETQYQPPGLKLQSFVVAATPQTLDFPVLAQHEVNDDPFALTATASSGLPVTFTTSTTDVCTLDGDQVTTLAIGMCTVRASAGNGSWVPVAIEHSFLVTAADQTLEFTEIDDHEYGDEPFALDATASSGLPVSFSSSTTDVCTVAGSTVTLVYVGVCTVEASAGNDVWASVDEERSFTIAPGAQTLQFATIANHQYGDDPIGVTATASSSLPVSFTTTTMDVCTISGGQVTIINIGTCNVWAGAGNQQWTPAVEERSFEVTAGVQSLMFPIIDDHQYGDDPFTITATASSGLPVTLSSSTEDVCTVAGDEVTIVDVGTCTVHASAGSDLWATAEEDRSFEVTAGEQTLEFPSVDDHQYGDDPFTITATASSGLPVTFTSSTEDVCTVEADEVTVVGIGTCTVQASAGSDLWATATADRSFAVTAGVQSLMFPIIDDHQYGDDPFTITATASSGLPVTLSSSTEDVCTVAGDEVTIVDVGTCTVHASAGSDLWATAEEDRSFEVTAGEQTLEFPSVDDHQYGDDPFTITATASSGLPVTFTSSTEDVCTVEADEVTVVGIGTCTVQASAGSDLWATATADRSFAVTAGVQSLMFPIIDDHQYGDDPFTITATASSGLPVTFTSSTEDVCTVEADEVTIIGVGTCTVQASAGSDLWATATADRSFDVAAAGQVLQLEGIQNVPLSSEVLAVTASSSQGLPVIITTDTPGVCTATDNGLTLLAAGTCIVRGTQPGDANVLAADPVTASFQVWRTPVVPAVRPLTSIVTVLGQGEGALHLAASTPKICGVSGGSLALIAPGVCRASVRNSANQAIRQVVVTVKAAWPSKATSQLGHSGTVLFDDGSAKLTPSSKQALRRVARSLRDATLVVVYGTRSSAGTAHSSTSLSRARAKAVASYLRTKGINARTVTLSIASPKPASGSLPKSQGRAEVYALP